MSSSVRSGMFFLRASGSTSLHFAVNWSTTSRHSSSEAKANLSKVTNNRVQVANETVPRRSLQSLTGSRDRSTQRGTVCPTVMLPRVRHVGGDCRDRRTTQLFAARIWAGRSVRDQGKRSCGSARSAGSGFASEPRGSDERTSDNRRRPRRTKSHQHGHHRRARQDRGRSCRWAHGLRA